MICDKKEMSEEGKFLVPLSITRIFELSKWCSPESETLGYDYLSGY